METRTLGRTGLEVTMVGFGSITIGGFFGPVDDAESMQALHAAIDCRHAFHRHLGCLWGRTQRADHRQVFARAPRPRPDHHLHQRRQQYGHRGHAISPPTTSAVALKAASSGSGSRSSMCTCCTIRRCRTSKPAIVLSCSKSSKRKGKIKHWGVSVNTLEECELAIACGQPAVMQMEYNLLEQDAAGVFAKAKAAGVGVISRVPLKRGLLSGRFDEHTDLRRRRSAAQNILAPDKLPAMVARVEAHLRDRRRLWPAAGRSGDPLLCLESRCQRHHSRHPHPRAGQSQCRRWRTIAGPRAPAPAANRLKAFAVWRCARPPAQPGRSLLTEDHSPSPRACQSPCTSIWAS